MDRLSLFCAIVLACAGCQCPSAAAKSEPCVAEGRETDPAGFVKCVFAPGGRYSLEPTSLLATESAPTAVHLLEEWTVDSAAVVSRPTRGAREYAVVSVALGGPSCRQTLTETLVRQSDGWRRLLPTPLARAENLELFEAAKVAVDWRQTDPFSIQALARLSQALGSRMLHRSNVELLRKVGNIDASNLGKQAEAINPKDDLVPVLFLEEADDDDAIIGWLERVPKKSCLRSGALPYALESIYDARKLMSFGGKQPDDVAALVVVARVLSSGEPDALMEYLTPARLDLALRGIAKKPQPELRAEKLGQLGLVLLRAGKREEAVKLLSDARAADPSQSVVRALDAALAGRTPQQVLGELCSALEKASCTWGTVAPGDAATIAMSWMGEELSGLPSLLEQLTAVSKAETSKRKQAFDDVMSKAYGRKWTCPVFDAMWDKKWESSKSCPSPR